MGRGGREGKWKGQAIDLLKPLTAYSILERGLLLADAVKSQFLPPIKSRMS